MPYVQTCCCGCTLKQGAIGIACFTLCLAVVLLVASLVTIGLSDNPRAKNATCMELHSKHEEGSNATVRDEKAFSDCIYHWDAVTLIQGICLIIACFFLVVAAICLIVTTNTNNRAYLGPFMVIAAATCLFLISVLVYAAYMSESVAIGLSIAVFCIVLAVLMAYFLLVVISYYQQLSEHAAGG